MFQRAMFRRATEARRGAGEEGWGERDLFPCATGVSAGANIDKTPTGTNSKITLIVECEPFISTQVDKTMLEIVPPCLTRSKEVMPRA